MAFKQTIAFKIEGIKIKNPPRFTGRAALNNSLT